MLALILGTALGAAVVSGLVPETGWLVRPVADALTVLVRPVHEGLSAAVVAALGDSAGPTVAARLLAPGAVALGLAFAALAGEAARKVLTAACLAAAVASYVWLDAGTATVAVATLSALSGVLLFAGRLVILVPVTVMVVALTVAAVAPVLTGAWTPAITLGQLTGADAATGELSLVILALVGFVALVPVAGAWRTLLRAAR